MNKLSPIARCASVARYLFVIAIIFFGIQHFIYGHFNLEPWPAWVPFPSLLAYAMGFLFIAIAFCVLIQKMDRQAAFLLGLLYLLNALLLQVPRVIADPHNGNEWTGCFEVLGICSGALALAGILSRRPPAGSPSAPYSGSPVKSFSSSAGLSSGSSSATFSSASSSAWFLSASSPAWDRFTTRLIRSAPYFFSACLVVCAMLHFVYAGYIATLIPSWIPARLFLSYFIGVAFLASAIGIAINRAGRLAAMLMGAMFYIWFAILHLPRVIANPQTEAEWTSAFVALAIGSTSWMLASLLPE
jgi:uncharacterized membrane protein